MVPDFRQNILQLDSYLLGGVLFTTGKNAVILHNVKLLITNGQRNIELHLLITISYLNRFALRRRL